MSQPLSCRVSGHRKPKQLTPTVAHDNERITGAQKSACGLQRDQSPQSRPHGCGGRFARFAMAALGAGPCTWTPSTRRSRIQASAVHRGCVGRPTMGSPCSSVGSVRAVRSSILGRPGSAARFPAPIGSKPGSMPPQDRVRLNDAAQTEQAWPEPCHPDQDRPVSTSQPRTV